MALLTDDCDINRNELMVDFCDNGDWYVRVKAVEADGTYIGLYSVRVSLSGGVAPSEVKLAVAELGKTMYKHKLNEF
jgi:hypothetical protein